MQQVMFIHYEDSYCHTLKIFSPRHGTAILYEEDIPTARFEFFTLSELVKKYPSIPLTDVSQAYLTDDVVSEGFEDDLWYLQREKA